MSETKTLIDKVGAIGLYQISVTTLLIILNTACFLPFHFVSFSFAPPYINLIEEGVTKSIMLDQENCKRNYTVDFSKTNKNFYFEGRDFPLFPTFSFCSQFRSLIYFSYLFGIGYLLVVTYLISRPLRNLICSTLGFYSLFITFGIINYISSDKVVEFNYNLMISLIILSIFSANIIAGSTHYLFSITSEKYRNRLTTAILIIPSTLSFLFTTLYFNSDLDRQSCFIVINLFCIIGMLSLMILSIISVESPYYLSLNNTDMLERSLKYIGKFNKCFQKNKYEDLIENLDVNNEENRSRRQYNRVSFKIILTYIVLYFFVGLFFGTFLIQTKEILYTISNYWFIYIFAILIIDILLTIFINTPYFFYSACILSSISIFIKSFLSNSEAYFFLCKLLSDFLLPSMIYNSQRNALKMKIADYPIRISQCTYIISLFQGCLIASILNIYLPNFMTDYLVTIFGLILSVLMFKLHNYREYENYYY